MNKFKMLKKIYVKKVTSTYMVKSIIEKLKENFNITNTYEDIRELLTPMFSNCDDKMFHIKLCPCQDEITLTAGMFEFVDIENLPIKAKVIEYHHFKVYDKSPTYKKLFAISRLNTWNQLDQMYDDLKSIKVEKLNEEELFLYEKIKFDVDANKIINDYNQNLRTLINTNHYSKLCKELLLELAGEECIGNIEIDISDDTNAKYEEIMVHLHIDNTNIIGNTRNVLNEGCGIFGDTGVQHTNAFNEKKIHQIASKIDNTISSCQCVQHMYEISYDGTFQWDECETQRFLSLSEFEGSVKKQMYFLQQKADDIFEGLYKLLNVIRTQKIIGD
jgi:hypothetical protein